MENLEPETEKLFTCTTKPFGFSPMPEELAGRADARLCGGGCKEERALRDKGRLALSLLTGAWTGAHWTGCRSVRILRSMRRLIGSTGPEKGRLVIRPTGAETGCVSGVLGRNMLKRLHILVNDSSLVSRSCCLSKSTEAARDPERGRAAIVNKPFKADTGPLALVAFGPVFWDVAE